MREMIMSELHQAVLELVRGFAHFLPRFIVLLIIAFAGWVVAYLLQIFLRSILRLIHFDKLSENAGASQLLTKAALPPPTELAGRFAFWIAWLGFILLGVSVLGISGLQDQVAKFFLFLPRLVVALFIMFLGLLGAGFVARAALLAAVNANVPSPRLLSVSIRMVIIIFAVSMMFEELGVAEQTVLVAFGIAFGAVMFGLAIAFGLGGKDLARRFLEDRFARAQHRHEHGDELSPL